MSMLEKYVRNGKVIEAYLENNPKKILISSEFIDNMMKNLEIDEEEAVLTWLEDEEYIINEDQAELDTKAKENKVLPSLHRIKGERKQPVEKKPRTIKENPTKEMIIVEIAKAVAALNGVDNLVIENKGKIVTFDLGGESFKVDLVQKRKPKEVK